MKSPPRRVPVADAQIIDDTLEEVYVVSEGAQVIRTSLSTIRVMGRATQGVTILRPSEGDSVASISCVSDLNLLEEKAAKQSSKPKAAKQPPAPKAKSRPHPTDAATEAPTVA